MLLAAIAGISCFAPVTYPLTLENYFIGFNEYVSAIGDKYRRYTSLTMLVNIFNTVTYSLWGEGHYSYGCAVPGLLLFSNGKNSEGVNRWIQ